MRSGLDPRRGRAYGAVRMIGLGEVVVAWAAVTAWLGRLAFATDAEMPPWRLCYATLGLWAALAMLAISLDGAARLAH